MPETPPHDEAAFLSDPQFLAMVGERQSMIAIQQIGGGKVSLPAVTKEMGAKILAAYHLGDPMEVSEPDRFVGGHDMRGGVIYFPSDPLMENKEMILEAMRLIGRIRDKVKRRTNDISIFFDDDMLRDEEFALALLDADGSQWIVMPDDMQTKPSIMQKAVERSPRMLDFIARDHADLITKEMAETAVKLDGSTIYHVPPRLLSDELLTLAVDAPGLGGAYLPFVAHWMEQEHGIAKATTWSNRERTLKAVRQWPQNLKNAPEEWLKDDECIAVAAEAVRAEAMRAHDLPEALQCDDRIAAAFAEGLPRRRNAYGWLCDGAKEHPTIVAAVLNLLPDDDLFSRLPKHVRDDYERRATNGEA